MNQTPRPSSSSSPTSVRFRLRERAAGRGSILIVVLWVVLILSLMVSSFAVTMHVETRLVSFRERELKARELARSGIEFVKSLLAADLNPSTQPFAETDRRTRGTSASTAAETSRQGADYYAEPWHNNPDLVDYELGEGTFAVQVMDEQSRLNVNVMTPEQWRDLLRIAGVDSETATVIASSVGDWTDKDSGVKLNGAEDDYYMSLSPDEGGPYHCKNGPLDRIEELLLIRGMTPEIFYGHQAEGPSDVDIIGIGQFLTTLPFTKINVNTASPHVLQLLPGITADMADRLVRYRQGDDGLDGTEDDKPLQEWGEIMTVWGGTMSRNEIRQLQRYLDVRSSFFTIRSTGTVGSTSKTIVSTVYRADDGTMATVTWDENAPTRTR
jgi:general secretion pathway protein K